MDVDNSRPQDPSIPAEGAKAARPVVLQVVPRLESGGIARETVDTAVAIAAAGWRSLVASTGGGLVRELERAGVTHFTLPLERTGMWAARSNTGKLEQLIKSEGVHIVHARSGEPSWWARTAASRAGARFVSTYHHGVDGEIARFRKRIKGLVEGGETMVAVSAYVAGLVADRFDLPREKIRVVPRGLDLDVFNPNSVSAARMIQLTNEWRLPDAAPVILMPGTLVPQNGHDFMVEALSRLGRRDVRCVFLGADVGPPRHRQAIDDHIARANVSPMIQIVRTCRDMPAAYMLADVVVSAPTEAKDFAQVAVEGQGMGRPVVITDAGSAREIVVPGETGWLIPPGEPDALAAAINDALSMASREREVFADRAIAHIRASFSRERMCEANLALYDDLVGRAEAGSD